jgi:DMSO/TMAO reductase YedYZ molybdopterin-dependent catalytic subunit
MRNHRGKGDRIMRNTVLFVLIFICLFSAACSREASDDPVDTISGATMTRYREGEILEYEGERLDPAIGPRDNSILGIQYIDIDTYRLKITGLVDTPVEYKYEDILRFDAYERKITLYCVEGWDATILWKGVLLEELINSAGVRLEADTVIFHAADGYSDSLPLDTIISKHLLLAYETNGLTLPAELGYPFIVVAEDKYGYKWVRWVTEIELSYDENYLGFWEIGGYDIRADVPEEIIK